MSQLATIWGTLDAGRRTVVILATLAAFGAVLIGARMAATPPMSLLYAGLDPATAGEVIASLEQKNIPYDVRAGAIFVPTTERDRTRLTLASEGLPATGSAGYELLDGLSGFGTTAQMFDATYWRAKEGELARTIVSSPDIRAARVHIASPVRQPFQRATARSASVTVTSGAGQLDTRQAEAIRFLVASAVAGLSAEDVTVIDSVGGVVLQAGQGDGAAPSRSLDERTAELKANVERLLEARVGPGRAVVEVMIDADMDSQTITERVIDPTTRVAISSDAEEQSENEQNTGGNGVTVASNLPDGDAEGGGSSSSRNTTQTRERLNYEVSETRRERVIQPGQIRKISVAVLVDQIQDVAEDGTITSQPRSDEELAALRELVESAIGYDAARGDVVTMQSLQFPQTDGGGTLAEAAGGGLFGQLMPIIQSVVLGVVALVLGLFVVRPILTQPQPLPALSTEEDDAASGEIIEPGAAVPNPAENQIPAQLPGHIDPQKLENLRGMITEKSELTAEVLRDWIETPEAEKGAA